MDPAPPLKFASPLLDEETVAAAAEVLRSGHITSGPWVERFERDLAQFCGGRTVRTNSLRMSPGLAARAVPDVLRLRQPRGSSFRGGAQRRARNP